MERKKTSKYLVPKCFYLKEYWNVPDKLDLDSIGPELKQLNKFQVRIQEFNKIITRTFGAIIVWILNDRYLCLLSIAQNLLGLLMILLHSDNA